MENKYFDESVFTDGLTLRNTYDTVNVSNNADKYLVSKLGLNVVSEYCTQIAEASDNDHNDRTKCYRYEELSSGMLGRSRKRNKQKINSNNLYETVVNLNPKIPCNKMNIYSMDIYNKSIQYTLRNYNSIKVKYASNLSNNSKVLPIFIGEPNTAEDVIYDVGMLSDFESAIMIKYFATISSVITITKDLYNVIRPFFDSNRNWFYFEKHETTNSFEIYQNERKELICQNNYVFVPNLTIAGPEVFID